MGVQAALETTWMDVLDRLMAALNAHGAAGDDFACPDHVPRHVRIKSVNRVTGRLLGNTRSSMADSVSPR